MCNLIFHYILPLAEKPHFIKFPQDLTIHDFAEYETKARAEGIPKPTLHWIKDGKPFEADQPGVKISFDSASDVQITSDFSVEHFGKANQGNVSQKHRIFLKFHELHSCVN